MRVFYLTNIPAPYRVKFWNQLGKQCELTVVLEKQNESNRAWEITGVGENFKAYFLPGITVATEFHFNPSIIRHLKDFQYDVYVISGYASPTEMMAINYLTKHNIPYIFSADGGFPGHKKYSIKSQIRQTYISSATKYMSSGSMCDEYLIESGARLEDIYRYNFTSIVAKDLREPPVITQGRREAILKRYGLKDKIVISVGQFIHRKGFDLLLDMWGHVQAPDASLLIVGGGPKRKQYEKYIKENNIQNVVLVDFIPSAKLYELMRLSRLFVFPSRYDIWGMVIGEAMACGLPVLSSSNVAAAHDLIVHGENGYVEALDRPIRWARRMEEFLEDEEKYRVFSQKAKDTMVHYTIEGMVDSYMFAFKDMVRQYESI